MAVRTHNPPVVGTSPTRSTLDKYRFWACDLRECWSNAILPCLVTEFPPRGEADERRVSAHGQELSITAVLRAAWPVVEFGSVVAASNDCSRSVVRIHHGLDEDQLVVRGAERFSQVRDRLDQERPRGGVRSEDFRQLGIGPGGDVVVVGGLAHVTTLDGVPAVVDQE